MTSRKDSVFIFCILLSCCIMLCRAEGEAAAAATSTAAVVNAQQNNLEGNEAQADPIKPATSTEGTAQVNKTQPAAQAAKPELPPAQTNHSQINNVHTPAQANTKQPLTKTHFDDPTIALNEKLPNLTEAELAAAQHSPQVQIQSNPEPFNKVIDHPSQFNLELAHPSLRQEEIEQLKYEEQLEQQNSGLKPWIVQQMKHFDQHLEAIVTESFEFVLDSQASFEFRWNPPKTKQLRLSVMLFQIKEEGEITLMLNNEYTEHVNILVREEGEPYMKAVGEVYISRIFSINFDTDYKYFNFTSKIPQSVLVMVDLEKLDEVVPLEGVARDKNFSLAQAKLQLIQQEVISGEKIREHTYKYEWGYLENQYAHEGKLLGLTGFELILIMSCAVMQLYFIKSLLDNRAVV